MKKPHTTRRSVFWRLMILGLALWLLGMGCLTHATIQTAKQRCREDYQDRAQRIAPDSLDDPYEVWGAVGTDAWNHGKYQERYAANAVYDGSGNLIACSWEPFFYFEALTPTQWENGEERSQDLVRAFFDPEWLQEDVRSSFHFDAFALRATGVREGTDFRLSRLEYVAWDDYADLHLSGSFTVSQLVEHYDLPWRLLYENPDVLAPGETAEVLYADWTDICYLPDSPGFTLDDTRYASLADFLAQEAPGLKDGMGFASADPSNDHLLYSVSYCYTAEGETYFGSLCFPEDGQKILYYTVSAVYATPWKEAVRSLIPTYWKTAAAALLLTLLLWRTLRREVVAPVEETAKCLSGEIAQPETATSWHWRELQQIAQGLYHQREAEKEDKLEIHRLEAALDYAKSAEGGRRQLVSNLAHELKTPLAVIHSYAEGLKEHIAEDKREKYLSILLSETERMDAMVLEMLDLSRLEAGKVKLARDTFSLGDLARETFGRLERAMEAKNLTLTWDIPEQSDVVADEARIAQVMENFATNALKYTPPGGNIHASITLIQGMTRFSLTNTSPPLSSEALAHVFDSFYRADDARAGHSTGLGLAIARQIVELHGGSCRAENVPGGVRFSFQL